MKAEEQLQGQLDMFNLDIWYGRTSQEHTVRENQKEQTFKLSSKKSVKSSVRTAPLFLSLKEGGTTQETSMEWEMMELPLAFHGEHMTLNTGERPSEIAVQEMCSRWGLHSVAEESRLSQILEEHPHPKYNLSDKASAGILRRAQARGKELPELLRVTLEKQAKLFPSKNVPDVQGGVKEYSSKENEQDHCYQAMPNQSYNPKCYATQACGDRDNPSQSYLEEKAYTIPSNPMSDRGQSVCYGMSPYDSNAMKSNNPNSGFYEAETARTLDNNGGNPNCNQGGMLVVDSHDITINEERTNALLHGKNDNHNVPCVLGIDRASFNQGKNAKYDISIQEEIAQPLVARGPGGVMTP